MARAPRIITGGSKMKNLSRALRAITVIPKILWQCDSVRLGFVPVGRSLVLEALSRLRFVSRQNRRARRITPRHNAICVRKEHPTRRQPLQVWRLDGIALVEQRGPVVHVINHDEQHVWFLRRTRKSLSAPSVRLVINFRIFIF